MLRTFVMLAFGVALIAWGAASFAKLSSSSNRGEIVAQLAAPVLDRVEALTDRVPRPAEDGPLTMRIVATGGSGVANRSSCADEARAGGALVEGTLVTVAARGEAACFGWTLVAPAQRDGAASPAQQTWVRDVYLEAVAGALSDAAADSSSN